MGKRGTLPAISTRPSASHPAQQASEAQPPRGFDKVPAIIIQANPHPHPAAPGLVNTAPRAGEDALLPCYLATGEDAAALPQPTLSPILQREPLAQPAILAHPVLRAAGTEPALNKISAGPSVLDQIKQTRKSLRLDNAEITPSTATGQPDDNAAPDSGPADDSGTAASAADSTPDLEGAAADGSDGTEAADIVEPGDREAARPDDSDASASPADSTPEVADGADSTPEAADGANGTPEAADGADAVAADESGTPEARRPDDSDTSGGAADSTPEAADGADGVLEAAEAAEAVEPDDAGTPSDTPPPAGVRDCDS